MGIIVALLVIMLLLSGCAEGHCRHPVAAPAANPSFESPGASADKTSAEDHVLIYKYDGSLQCNSGKVVSPEAMAKQLQGIPVLSSSKKTDGLKHIQACGSITGRANVFEIPAQFEKDAEAKGFKKWSFE